MKWELYPIFQQEAWAALQAELRELQEILLLDERTMVNLAAQVSEFPLASTVLLHLLRHNERCLQQGHSDDALFAESLAFSTLQGSAEFKQWLATHPATMTPSAMLDGEPLQLRREDNQLLIRFNRPQARNAYSAMMRDALHEALLLLDADSSIERCVMDGAGDCFCVGGDLTEFGLATDPAQAHVIRMTRHVAALLAKHTARIECRVHRACIGSGIELSAFAGKLIATHDTFFQLPELAMGLIPGAGGTVSILKRIGRHRLAWWVLSGKKIKADIALQWGLVDEIM